MTDLVASLYCRQEITKWNIFPVHYLKAATYVFSELTDIRMTRFDNIPQQTIGPQLLLHESEGL